MNVRQAIPLLIQEGWTRHQEEVAKPPLTERTGWSGMEPLLRNLFRNASANPTTPSAPLRWLRIFFLMAQPPLLYQEGNSSLTVFHTFIDRACGYLFPGRIHRLADQKGGVYPLPRPEFLHPATVNFGDIKIAFLIDAKAVNTPESPGEIAPYAERVEEVSFQIVLQHLRCSAIERPESAVGANIDQVNIRGLCAGAPLIKIFSVLIECLNAMIAPIVDKHPPRLRIDGNSVNIVEISWTFVIWRISFLTPVHQEFAVFVEFCDAGSVVAIGDKHRAVRKPCEKRRPVEVGAVGAVLLRRANRLHELFAVVSEFVDGMHVVINDPNVFVRVIGIDRNEVRTLQNLVPLRPAFDNVAVGIGHQDTVLPFCIHADCSGPPICWSSRNSSGAAAPR